jgi:hypothetical protein
MSRIAMLLAPAVAFAAKKEEPSSGGIDMMALLNQLAIHPILDAYEATVGLGLDVVKYTMATPQSVADFYVYMAGLLRAVPAFAKDIYEGDAGSMDKVATFCVGTAASIFTVYAGLAALNLLLAVLCASKDYVTPYMRLPTKSITIPVVGGSVPIPKPVSDLLGLVQKHLLDKIIAWEVKAWVLPLEGHHGTPTLKGTASSVAAAISATMILSCTPAVLSLIKGGANKGDAEAIAYTLGTALGLQWAVKKVA